MLRLIDIPWWYFIIATAIGIVVGLWKKPSLGILAGYTFLLLVETVIIRIPFAGQHFEPEFFWSWKAWKDQKKQILVNVIMFIPVGLIGDHLWKGKGIWIATGVSVLIEVLQLVTARGLFEFDDVIHNMLGAAIGIGIIITLQVVKKKIEGVLE